MPDTPFQAMLADLYFRGRKQELELDQLIHELVIHREIADNAALLLDFLGQNTGEHPDFPVQIIVNNADATQEFVERLTDLNAALLAAPAPEDRYDLGDFDANIDEDPGDEPSGENFPPA